VAPDFEALVLAAASVMASTLAISTIAIVINALSGARRGIRPFVSSLRG
jgi:hypothetical protein